MIYYIRAIEQDWPKVEALAIMLEVAQRADTSELVGQGWVHIGPIYKPTGETVIVEGLPVEQTAPVLDDLGNLYIHANLVMEGSLRELAEAKALQHPEIAEAL